mmetsp:Transcript_24987/g.80744  ORF Transcript_24987/g.80744 Transcript_24987/m.80744 type:complete len:359 (-) Transcript_24987:1493-2569(-)|eukprot:scaffold4606_cov107-Isochrysis_galbana.AAC.6
MVPLYPKEETVPVVCPPPGLARLGPGTNGAGCTHRAVEQHPPALSAAATCGLSRQSWAFVGASRPVRSPQSWMSPAAPAAASACPALALIPPMAARAKAPNASADASTASPSGVPVPCASQADTNHPSPNLPSPGVFLDIPVDVAPPSPARLSVAVRSERWAPPFGAVKLALLPSCCTHAACSRAEVLRVEAGSPAACPCAPASGPPTVTAQHASARAYPSARASNVRQRPTIDVSPAMAYAAPVAGRSIRCTAATSAGGPPTTAGPPASAVRLRSAPCAATSADEQAVSYVTALPCSPRTNARRPDATDGALAVARKADRPPDPPARAVTASNSREASPTWTPTAEPCRFSRRMEAA